MRKHIIITLSGILMTMPIICSQKFIFPECLDRDTVHFTLSSAEARKTDSDFLCWFS
ncbi:MAG: hypothetical protein LBE13_22895 [Bacteroidales bacterium]|nr:hypothetical protein [Bacteroidales bacterium]